MLVVVAFLLWGRSKKSTFAAPALPSEPVVRSTVEKGSAAASFAAYRQAHPSNMLGGHLTCHHCGNTAQSRLGDMVSCNCCHAALYGV